jgi:hypothetical protein
MVKRKSLPKNKENASYASRTANSVHDTTKESIQPNNITAAIRAPAAGKALVNNILHKKQSTKTVINRRGVKVLKEIQTLQKTTNLLIPRAPFIRLVRLFEN